MSSTTEGRGFFDTILHPGRIGVIVCGLVILQPLYIAFRYLLAGGYRAPEWEHLALIPTASGRFDVLARAFGEVEGIPPQSFPQDPLPGFVSHATVVGLLLFSLVILPTAIILLLRARAHLLETDPSGAKGRLVAIVLSLAIWASLNVVSGQVAAATTQWGKMRQYAPLERSWRQYEEMHASCATAADRAHLLLLTRGLAPDSVVTLLCRERTPSLHARSRGVDTVEVGVVLDGPGVDPEFANIDGRRGRTEVRYRAVKRGIFVETWNMVAPE
jgi:hypothetical protein